MKTSSKNLGKCQVKLTVELSADEIKAVIKDTEKVFVREAAMPGFRKGKIPIEVIRKEFAASLKQEIERAMFQKNYPEAVKAEKIDEVALADVQDINYGENGGSFVAVVEVKPVFKLPAYKGLKIEEKSTAVDDSAVADHIERLRAAYATYEDAKEDDTVCEGDFVQIDYEGSVGSKKILEINPEAKIVGEGKGFWTQVEEGRFLPEILDALKGMKAGESKDGIKAKFDKDSAPDGLKGAKAVYSVQLKSFRKRVIPTDEQFVEKAKASSIEELTRTVRESLEKNAVAEEAARRENEAVELLMKKMDFDVPSSLVRKAKERFLMDFAQRAQYSGLDAAYFEKNQEKILKDAEDAAVKQVRLWCVIDAIAAAEDISCADEEKGKKVIEFVLANVKK